LAAVLAGECGFCGKFLNGANGANGPFVEERDNWFNGRMKTKNEVRKPSASETPAARRGQMKDEVNGALCAMGEKETGESWGGKEPRVPKRRY
jgi:hypothetical protein